MDAVIFTIPCSNGEDFQPVPFREDNYCHLPDGTLAPKGQGTCKGGPTTKGTPRTLQGVDSKANGDRMVAEAHRFSERYGDRPADVRMREEQLAEATLRQLPLVHGTSVEGAVAAVSEGLQSSADLEDERQLLEDDMADLIKTVQEKVGQKLWVDDDWDVSRLENEFEVSREVAESVMADLTQIHDLQKVVGGTTYPADKELGLDQFVFLTHGQLHQDYGPLGVVVDNKLLKDGWATPQDIVKTLPETAEDTGATDRYSDERIAKYRSGIVGEADYYRAAAAAAGSVRALAYRSRDQLWEVKVPRVPKQAVLGFVVHDDLDLALRLRDRLAMKGLRHKVLYISEPSRGEHARWMLRQMKHIQRTGSWNLDLARQWENVAGSGEIFVL